MLETIVTQHASNVSSTLAVVSDVVSDMVNNAEYIADDEKVSYEDYFDPRLPKWLSVVLLVVGLFGNMLSIWVFAQRQMRKHSTFVYLAFLCFVDLYVLMFGLGDVILISHASLILRNKSLLVCRLHTFLTYVFTHLSSFILASVSVDRAIATNAINFAKSYCRPRVAHRVILANVGLAILINFHSLIFLGYEDHALSPTDNQTITTHFYCSSQKDTRYDRFMETYFKWIDLIFYAILPFIIMAICSFFIINVMFASNKRLKKTLNVNTSSLVSAIKANFELQNGSGGGGGGGSTYGQSRGSCDLSADSDRQRSLIARMSRRSTTYLVEKRRTSGAPMHGRLHRTLHLTYTLISINALFFCLVSPLVILSIAISDVRKYKLLFNICYLLAYANHSFNFVFYGLSSPPYRECIMSLCCGSSGGLSRGGGTLNMHNQQQQQQQQQPLLLKNRRSTYAGGGADVINDNFTATATANGAVNAAAVTTPTPMTATTTIKSILRNGTVN